MQRGPVQPRFDGEYEPTFKLFCGLRGGVPTDSEEASIWQCILKMTEKHHELISEEDVPLGLSAQISGVSFTEKRYGYVVDLTHATADHSVNWQVTKYYSDFAAVSATHAHPPVCLSVASAHRFEAHPAHSQCMASEQ